MTTNSDFILKHLFPSGEFHLKEKDDRKYEFLDGNSLTFPVIKTGIKYKLCPDVRFINVNPVCDFPEIADPLVYVEFSRNPQRVVNQGFVRYADFVSTLKHFTDKGYLQIRNNRIEPKMVEELVRDGIIQIR